MDARQIQDLRAMLASQTTAEDTRRPGLGRTLKSLLAPRSATRPSTPLCFSSEASIASPPDPLEHKAPLLLEADLACPTREIRSGDVISPMVLLGDLAPRRSAFGQRAEPVLELNDPAPAGPRRLTLMADGAAVGEIILHGGDIAAASDIAPRRPFEPLHSEVPFFPDDLADDLTAPRRPDHFRKAAKAAPLKPETPTPELAAAFMLATLAARLASEEAALNRRLAAAQAPSEAA